MDEPLLSLPSPHLRDTVTVRRIMADVLLALTPAALGSIYLFGTRVVPYYLVAMGVASLCDFLVRGVLKKERYVFDLSPLVTGMLLAMSLPSNAPLWFPALGAAFAIVVAKEAFGGIGRNFLNPALAGRAVLRLLFVEEMTANVWPDPSLPFASAMDAVTGATPLMLAKEADPIGMSRVAASFLGTVGGKLGETSALLLLLGAAYLLWRRVINWRIPVSMLASIAAIGLLAGGNGGLFSADFDTAAVFVLGGASILGAFYMATDYSSSPSAPKAQIIYGALLGLVTMLWRFYSSYSEGFTFALLIMNFTVPVFNRYVRPRVVGEGVQKPSANK